MKLISSKGVYSKRTRRTLEEIIETIESNHNLGKAVGSNLDIADALNWQNQGIAVAGNSTQVQTNGYQMFDKDNATYVSGHYIDDNGIEQSSTVSGYLETYIPVEAETTYTIQGKLKGATTNIGIYYYDESKNWISRITITQTSLPYTFTTPSNCAYIQFQYTMANYDANTVMIEPGDTAHDWEQYTGGQPSPSPDYLQPIVDVTGTQDVIVRNKNLFNINGDVNRRYDGSTPSSQANYNVVNGNELTANINSSNYAPFGQKIFVGAGSEITASFILSGITYNSQPELSDNVASVVLYQDNTTTGRLAKNCKYQEIGNRLSVTFTALTDYIYVTFGRTSNSTSATFADIQVEIGFIATSYAAYKHLSTTLHLGDIVLRSIPNTEYADRIKYENGKWWLEQNINKEVLDGTESWGQATSSPSCDRFILAKNTNRNGIKVYNAISSHFKNTLVTTEQTVGTFSIDSTTNGSLRGRVFFNYSELGTTTLEQFITWLGNNNVTIQYILGTPITTEITDQTLLADLNTLLPVDTYKEHTIIEVTPATGNPAQIEIKYLKDDRIEQAQEIENIKSALLSLGANV